MMPSVSSSASGCAGGRRRTRAFTTDLLQSDRGRRSQQEGAGSEEGGSGRGLGLFRRRPSTSSSADSSLRDQSPCGNTAARDQSPAGGHRACTPSDKVDASPPNPANTTAAAKASAPEPSLLSPLLEGARGRVAAPDDEGAAVEEAPEPLYLPASGSSRKGQDPDEQGAASGPEAGEDVGSDTLDKALTRSFLAQ